MDTLKNILARLFSHKKNDQLSKECEAAMGILLHLDYLVFPDKPVRDFGDFHLLERPEDFIGDHANLHKAQAAYSVKSGRESYALNCQNLHHYQMITTKIMIYSGMSLYEPKISLIALFGLASHEIRHRVQKRLKPSLIIPADFEIIENNIIKRAIKLVEDYRDNDTSETKEEFSVPREFDAEVVSWAVMMTLLEKELKYLREASSKQEIVKLLRYNVQ